MEPPGPPESPEAPQAPRTLQDQILDRFLALLEAEASVHAATKASFVRLARADGLQRASIQRAVVEAIGAADAGHQQT